MIRGRLHRARRDAPPARRASRADEVVEIDAGQLSGLFALPDWLRNIGLIAWLTTGVIVLLLGLVWLLSLANTIVHAADHGRDRRRGRLAGRALAERPRPAARRGRGPAAARRSSCSGSAMIVLIVGGIAGETSRRQRPSEGRREHDRRLAQGPRRRPEARPRRAPTTPARRQRRVQGAAARRGEGDRGPVGAGLLPRADGAEPVLPAQGRPDDPRLDRARAADPAAGRRDRRRGGCCSRCAATSSGSR